MDISIIHAHFALDAVTALPIAEALKVPLFVTLHGHDVNKSDKQLSENADGRRYLMGRSRLFARADKFLCVSHSIRKAALKAGFPEEKLHVHYTGIDCTRLLPVTTPRDEKLVLFVGRLVEKSGCAYLLHAMEMVQKHDPAAHVEIIGDGPLREELERLAEELGVRANFRGVLDTEQVRLSMSRARVVCDPSVTAANGDSEGFGMVLAEAQALGTPVVSSMHAAISEAVSQGKTGLLCPERDPYGLADALLAFIGNDWYWKRTSARAAAWVRDRFDVVRQTAKLEAFFDGHRFSCPERAIIRG
jgi:glycosyltransferase involved in cell wall biosynthesis